jgi:hypothetical protein
VVIQEAPLMVMQMIPTFTLQRATVHRIVDTALQTKLEMTREMQVCFWQHYNFLNSQNLRKNAAWLMAIKFMNKIQLNQEITSITSPAYFLRSQNVGFRKQMLNSYSVSSHKPEDGAAEVFNLQTSETSGKIYLRKKFLQKIFIYFGTNMYMNNKLAYPEEGGSENILKRCQKITREHVFIFQKTVNFISSSVKTSYPKAHRLVIL